MENKPKNREWVKTAAIVFLSVLLVLTFFSNTILNRTLPEVSTAAVTDGTITAKVRMSGTVAAIGNNEIKAAGTRTIASVKIKAGQEVNEGDVLFVMGSAESDELEAAEDARDSAYYSYRRSQANYPSNSSAAMDRAYAEWESANLQADVALQLWAQAEANPELTAAQDALATAEYNLSVAQIYGDEYRAQKYNEYLSLQASITEMTPELQVQLDLLLSEATSVSDRETYAQYDYNQKQDRYYALVSASSASELKTAYETARIKADSAYASYLAAVDAYNATAEANGRTYASVAIDVEEAEHTLEKRQAKLDALSGEGEDANVYARVGGIVETVNFSAGDTVAKGDVLCIIEVPDMGYSMSASVTVDQARRLKVGDSAQVSNYYWGKTITAEISSIKSDPKDPQGKRLITFDIYGDVNSGQELTVSVGEKSAGYDIVVPKSAVMSDNNGSFVLIISSRSSPLGNRYYAKRVDVEILAEDDSFKAVSGNLGNGDFVITNSSTKINAGDQIRLADSSN